MSEFIVSARKYRPQRFDEVVGQQHVSQTLKNALQNDHLAHAFLFCGPRGVGKTTCARILAKTLNCQNVTEDFEPCNSCDNCESFANNASFNITELDAASNNSVEHIRALIEQVRFQPQQGKYKVFIIDEVHMLSQSAFNAFLKTLEEPPSYAIFILATTEKHKIIPTILSRCQIFDFKRIQTPDMVAHLEEISQKEGIKAEQDALHIIAQKADGALRDALSIFDRIVSFSGDKMTYEDVINNLNVLDYDYFFRLVDALLLEDIQKTLLIFDDIQRKGFDADLFVTGLAEHLRNLLVCKDQQTIQLLDTSDSLKERYAKQAAIAGTDFLLTTINLTNDCDINYKLARNKRLHVEITLLKMASIGRAFRLAEGNFIQKEEKKTPDTSLNVTAPQKSPPKEEFIPPSEINEPVVEQQPSETKPISEKQMPVQDIPLTPSSAVSEAAEKIDKETKGTTSISNGVVKANLSNMLDEIRKEEAIEKEVNTEVQFQDVQNAWNIYLNKVERDSLRIQLKSAKLEVEGLKITVQVGSNLAEGAIKGETNLTDFLREKLNAPGLVLSISVDNSMKQEKKITKPKILNAKEKFLFMREQNPAVDALRKKFDLRPDE